MSAMLVDKRLMTSLAIFNQYGGCENHLFTIFHIGLLVTDKASKRGFKVVSSVYSNMILAASIGCLKCDNLAAAWKIVKYKDFFGTSEMLHVASSYFLNNGMHLHLVARRLS